MSDINDALQTAEDSVVESVESVDNNTEKTGAALLDSVTNPAAAIGATQAAITENATKLAHALESVNPLTNLIPSTGQTQGPIPQMLTPVLPGRS